MDVKPGKQAYEGLMHENDIVRLREKGRGLLVLINYASQSLSNGGVETEFLALLIPIVTIKCRLFNSIQFYFICPRSLTCSLH